ncbi:unnamed protein product [Sphagnum balticum]
MKSLTYQERLLQSQEDKNTQKVKFQVTDAHLQLQQNILNTDRSLAEAKIALEDAKSANPFNAQKIIDAQLIVESKEDAMTRLHALQTELFEPKPTLVEPTWDKQGETKQEYVPVKKSKAKTEAGKKRAEAAGLAVE